MPHANGLGLVKLYTTSMIVEQIFKYESHTLLFTGWSPLLSLSESNLQATLMS